MLSTILVQVWYLPERRDAQWEFNSAHLFIIDHGDETSSHTSTLRTASTIQRIAGNAPVSSTSESNRDYQCLLEELGIAGRVHRYQLRPVSFQIFPRPA